MNKLISSPLPSASNWIRKKFMGIDKQEEYEAMYGDVEKGILHEEPLLMEAPKGENKKEIIPGEVDTDEEEDGMETDEDFDDEFEDEDEEEDDDEVEGGTVK